MYRKWVYERHGPLGKRHRVRIPRCVVEAIRSRFREPGCECAMGGPLYVCKRYCGHQEAPQPPAEEDEEDEAGMF